MPSSSSASRNARGDDSDSALQPGTPIECNKKPATAKELKAGRSVVVQVVGDTPYDADLHVASVTIVPSIAAARAKSALDAVPAPHEQ